ncbi:hypothetical protein JNW88_03825 [Micromonospora sp. ATA32]|nr:hypothetical protein [Micromonospora sp. ATA32]
MALVLGVTRPGAVGQTLPVTDEAIDHYRQLLARYPGGLQDAMCVTYARGIDEDAFIRAFGGDPAATATRRHQELGEDLSGYHYNNVPCTLLVTRVDEWLVGDRAVRDAVRQNRRPEQPSG